MKKLSTLLVSIAVLATSTAFSATPYAMFLQQINDLGNNYWTIQVPFTGDQLWGYDKANEVPKPIIVGSGLSLNTSTWTLSATGGASRSFTLNPSRTIQTVAAAGNGWQIDASRDADVTYSVNTSSTATIGGNSSAYVVLEVAATNSSTAGDWTEIGRSGNSQVVTLAVILQSVQTVQGSIHALIPAGYYVRMRSVLTGTSSATYLSGSEVKL